MMQIIKRNKINLKKRQALVSSIPCFSSFTEDESRELCELLQEVSYLPEEKIVDEGELVDSIYIIDHGIAEVSINDAGSSEAKSSMPLAILTDGECIGLKDTGFYSTTGKRTATVLALTSVYALRLDVVNLNDFLERHHLESAMLSASTRLLRMWLIKQSLPFSKLSHERLEWLADNVEEISVAANKTIFEENDKGDSCYLIREGEVGIYTTVLYEKKQLAVLKTQSLFGEATLISQSPRNATAIALTETKLLTLKHKDLSELIESDSNIANMFMGLMIDRSRPAKNPRVTIHERIAKSNEEITILKNPDNGSYYKLSKEGAYVWSQMNGAHTMQELTLNLAIKHNVFAPNMVAAIISRLTKSGFIENVKNSHSPLENSAPLWARAICKIRDILETRVAIGHANKWVTNIYNKWVHYLFTWPCQLLIAIIVILGIGSFCLHTVNILHYFAMQKSSLWLLLLLIPLNIFQNVLHELGHAFAVKYANRDVHYIGVGWYWFGPVTFTDTSDMWLASQKQKFIVNIAGIYVDVLVAAMIALFLLLISNPLVQGVLWLFSLFILVNALRMFSPLQEMDGYYLLMDWLDKQKLRRSSVIWLINKMPGCLAHPAQLKHYKPELFYWLACILYLAVVIVVTLVLQAFVFKIIGIEVPNIYISLIMPFSIVLFSCFSMIADIRHEVED